MACQVKADMDSRAFLGLKSASAEVKKATANLVISAQRALDIEKQNDEAEAASNVVKDMKHGGRSMNEDWKQELALKEEIERAMREQERRYKQLKEIRENRYQKVEKEEEQQEKANQSQYKKVTGHD